MRVQAIGVKRMSGIGKETGNPFDFAQIEILRPMENAAKGKFKLEGYGYETLRIDLSNDAIHKFAEVRFPASIDLVIDTIPGRQGLRSVVVGFTRAVDTKTGEIKAA